MLDADELDLIKITRPAEMLFVILWNKFSELKKHRGS
jgi:hypothetical protein